MILSLTPAVAQEQLLLIAVLLMLIFHLVLFGDAIPFLQDVQAVRPLAAA